MLSGLQKSLSRVLRSCSSGDALPQEDDDKVQQQAAPSSDLERPSLDTASRPTMSTGGTGTPLSERALGGRLHPSGGGGTAAAPPPGASEWVGLDCPGQSLEELEQFLRNVVDINGGRISPKVTIHGAAAIW